MIATQGALATFRVVLTHHEYCVCLQWEPVCISRSERLSLKSFIQQALLQSQARKLRVQRGVLISESI